MKFGKTFLTHQIPEWSIYYMNYKHLKKRIKTVDLVVNQDELPPSEIPELIGSILADFFFELDRDIEKVDAFYNNQYKDYSRRLDKVTKVLGYLDQTEQIDHQIKSSDELDEIVSILLELRTSYRNLKWFGELNHKGFTKILKKLDKKLIYLNTLSNEHNLDGAEQFEDESRRISLPVNHKDNYLATRVNALPFANGSEVLLGLAVINSLMNMLGAEKLITTSPYLAPSSVSGQLLSQNMLNSSSENVNLTNLTNNSTSKNQGYLKIGDSRYALDQESVENIQDLITKDNVVALEQRLKAFPPNKGNIRFFIALLNRATQLCSYKSMDCIFSRLQQATETPDNELSNALCDVEDISGRNFFHMYAILLGKRQKINEIHKSQADLETFQNRERDLRDQRDGDMVPGETAHLNRRFGSTGGPDGVQLTQVNDEGLTYIFEKFIMKDDDSKAAFGKLFNMRDSYLRTPLHYAAQYGLKSLSGLFIDYLNKLGLIPEKTSIDDVSFWGDQEGLTPLHLAIIGKHPKTTASLIMHSKTTKLTSNNLLLLAVRISSVDLLEILIDQGGIDINYSNDENNQETSLYIAAKLNLLKTCEFLLSRNADPNLSERVFGWTPLFIAALEGYMDIVKLLIENGAVYDKADDSGWLPVEHASFRGHLEVTNILIPSDPTILQYDIKDTTKNIPRQKLGDSGAESPSPTPSISSENGDLNRLYKDNLSALSILKLPEPNKNVVNEVYRQLKNLDTTLGNNKATTNTSSNATSTSTSPSISTSANTAGNKAFPGSQTEHAAATISRSRSPFNKRKINPIKSFGHKYLNPGELLMLITLGTTDGRDYSEPIELNRILMAKSFFTELDTALSLVVTCRDSSAVSNNRPLQPPIIIDLPLEDQHGSASDPIAFKLGKGVNPQNTIITFDVVPTYQYSSSQDLDNPIPQLKKKILGRAVAIMRNAYTSVGQNLRSLNNNITVPIIESNTLDVLGSIRFEYLLITSFQHPKMSLNRSDTYWKQLVSTRVIGHRGLGKNVNDKKSLQLGENTVELFIAAASLGASYVEFDVQLTKDHVPVVYHDFTVAESGVDIPMHALTAEQFLGLNDNSSVESLLGNSIKETSIVGGTEPSKFKKNYSLDDEMLFKINRPRAMGSSKPDFSKPRDTMFEELQEVVGTGRGDEFYREYKDHIHNRMKLTKTWKEKGFKGNARGLSIASNFVTLSELFKKLPPSVGFNIELKYPMLDEAEMESMGEVAYDMNFYVDTILKCVYDSNVTNRDLMFSSFHPDICLLLSMKQPTIPILFLTEAGTAPMADIRASSLQAAIRFAKKWNLLGIVSAAQTLVKTPRLAQVVKSSGLVCVSYGVENNSYDLAKIQMKAGVDAVIVDSVLAVREGLRKDQETESE